MGKLEIHWNDDGTVTAKRGVDIWPEVGVREFSMPKDLTKEQLDLWLNRNTLLNRAIPQLDVDQAEFLLSGFLPGEYDTFFRERVDISLGDFLQKPVHNGSCNEAVAIINDKLMVALNDGLIDKMPDNIRCEIHSRQYVISFEPKEFENLVNLKI